MKRIFHRIILIVTLLVYLMSCRSTKNVGDDEYLLIENEIAVDGKRSFQADLKDYIIQRPNQKLLGLPFSLYFYNIGNPNKEQDYLKWIETDPGFYRFIDKTFTTKQALGMNQGILSLNQWFLDAGEAPVIYDNTKSSKSAQNLRLYYFNRGYFDATVSFDTLIKSKKKLGVKYKVNRGKPYILDSISYNFPSKTLDSLYTENINKSLIKPGEPINILTLEEEADRITNLYRNEGIYYFNKNLISFRELDTINDQKRTNLNLDIKIPSQEVDGEKQDLDLNIKKINTVRVYTDYSYSRRNEPYRDTVRYQGFTLLAHEKLDYNPKALTDAIFVEPNNIYSDLDRYLTQTRLRSLNNFSNVRLNYFETEKDSLQAEIFLTPMKKYNITINNEITHSNIKNFGISGKFSFLNRNSFKNAEILKLSFSGSFFNTSADVSDPKGFFNAWEFGIDASLNVPRVLLPFGLSELISSEKAPKTQVTLGTSLQKNIGLDNQKYTGIYNLWWKANPKISHDIDVFNIQYVRNLNIDEYFNIYSSEYNDLVNIQQEYFPDYPLTPENAIDFINDELDTPEFEQESPQDYQTALNIEKRYYIITDNNFIPTIAYTFTRTTQENFKDLDYSYFRARIASAGFVSNLFGVSSSPDDPKTVLGAPIAQYLRLDTEYKKFWQLNEHNSIGARVFLGLAMPYGNSSDLPFSRSYFVGGANDMRAWEIYELGPGASQTGLEYNVGSMKLLTSLEYRFKFIGKLNGALFVDAGNIWDITNSSLSEEDAKFRNLSSLKNAAIGSGFGARYDFSFLVLRLDFGFKTYEPYLSGSKWFRNYNFANAVYNIGINYPF